jgi:hypothetical protein
MTQPLWVVYKMTIRGNVDGMKAVCTRDEWDAMELAKPGQQPLLYAGIASEGQAERLARGTSGDPVKRVGVAARRDAHTAAPSGPPVA